MSRTRTAAGPARSDGGAFVAVNDGLVPTMWKA
jgi:hypothetical protein